MFMLDSIGNTILLILKLHYCFPLIICLFLFYPKKMKETEEEAIASFNSI